MKAGGRRPSAPFAPSGAYQSGNETSSHPLSERRDRDATRMATAAKTRHELNIRQRRGKNPLGVFGCRSGERKGENQRNDQPETAVMPSGTSASFTKQMNHKYITHKHTCTQIGRAHV